MTYWIVVREKKSRRLLCQPARRLLCRQLGRTSTGGTSVQARAARPTDAQKNRFAIFFGVKQILTPRFGVLALAARRPMVRQHGPGRPIHRRPKKSLRDFFCVTKLFDA